ncbi:MAG: 3-phosphoshikimate 1-carboxyvinyltransferase [Parcubacteria group bacterium]|nr:3-phosphoshikimate 1-carboxyvinyltransferase [Parcubacteria group bacterium]
MKKIEIIPVKDPIKGEIKVPGSKSYTNRALVMASLTKGTSELKGVSRCDDCVALTEALRKLGIGITQNGGEVTVIGNGGDFNEFKGEINVGQAGTTMRFLTAVCSLVPGEIILDGSDRMRERPISDLVNALRGLGADIEYVDKRGYPPLKIKGGKMKGGQVSVDGDVSSQYFTALLLIAPVLEEGIEIKVVGEQVSPSYINMTISGLRDFGVEAINNDYQEYIIGAESDYQPSQYTIEGDASGASYFWALAAVAGGQVKVQNIDPRSAQGDVEFADVLVKMGCKMNQNSADKWIRVIGPAQLKSIAEIDMNSMPDTAQTLAVVAAFAEGETKITGLQNLRVKETDRLTALQAELKKLKVKTEIGDDYIVIHGGNPKGAAIETHHDHRMAMSFAVAGVKISGVKISQPDVVNKSFPNFWEGLESLGVKLKRK